MKNTFAYMLLLGTGIAIVLGYYQSISSRENSPMTMNRKGSVTKSFLNLAMWLRRIRQKDVQLTNLLNL